MIEQMSNGIRFILSGLVLASIYILVNMKEIIGDLFGDHNLSQDKVNVDEGALTLPASPGTQSPEGSYQFNLDFLPGAQNQEGGE